MAYAQWYWTHLMRGQPNQPSWGQGQHGYGGMQQQDYYQGYGPVLGQPGLQMYPQHQQPQMAQMYPQQPYAHGGKVH